MYNYERTYDFDISMADLIDDCTMAELELCSINKLDVFFEDDDAMTEDEAESLMNTRLEEQCEEESKIGTLMVNFVYWSTEYDTQEWETPENEVEYFFSLPTESQVSLLNRHGQYGYPEIVLAPACNI